MQNDELACSHPYLLLAETEETLAMFTAKRNKAQENMDLLKHKQYIQHAELIAESSKQRQAKEQLRVDTEYHHKEAQKLKEAQKQKDTAPPERDTPPLMDLRHTVSATTAQPGNDQPGSSHQHANPAELEVPLQGQHPLSPGSLDNLFADFVSPVNGRSVHEEH